MVFVALSYFFGDVLLARLLGKDFAAAAPVLTLMLLAATFDLSASPLRSALYASGHAAKVLRDVQNAPTEDAAIEVVADAMEDHLIPITDE